MTSMFKPLLLVCLLPLTGCTLIELTDKSFKIAQTLSTGNQPVRIECTRLGSKIANTYTIDPKQDNVIVEEWTEDQSETTKQVEIWDLTERKSTSYVIENISRIRQNKDKKRGPMKVEVNLALQEVTLSKNQPLKEDTKPQSLTCSITPLT
ncbi:putative lipoprotein [Synechococcus sp. NOUM97013]|nr:putative lipoprotein [Synechococcus sp. NOUM97013]